jgi:uncharacterized protein YbjT (DUF2867 family)
MKALIAGASGFVGRRLCAALAGTGHDVVAMTRNPAAYTGAGTPSTETFTTRTPWAPR